MRLLKDVARAILKLALFILFVFLLAKPLGLLMLSLWDRRTEPSVVECVSHLIGSACQFSIMYIGMLIAFFITQKLRNFRLLQVLFGFAVMAGAYFLSAYALRSIIAFAAALVGGMISLALIATIAIVALNVFLWVSAGPWWIILWLSNKDD